MDSPGPALGTDDRSGGGGQELASPALAVPARVPIPSRRRELGLLMVLGGVFLLGFSEAVVVAIPLVATFLGLNAVVVAVGIGDILADPGVLSGWTGRLMSGSGVGGVICPALAAFPLLVLGLSGFGTGVSMTTGRRPQAGPQ